MWWTTENKRVVNTHNTMEFSYSPTQVFSVFFSTKIDSPICLKVLICYGWQMFLSFLFLCFLSYLFSSGRLIHPKGYKHDETTLYLAINYGDSVLAARIISSGKVQDFGCALNSRALILLSVFKMVGLKIKRCPLYGLPWLKLLLSRYYCTEVHKSMFKIGKKLPWS